MIRLNLITSQQDVSIRTPNRPAYDRTVKFLESHGLKRIGNVGISPDGYDTFRTKTVVCVDWRGDYDVYHFDDCEDDKFVTLGQFKEIYVDDGAKEVPSPEAVQDHVGGNMPVVITPVVLEQHAIKELDYNDCKIWLAIDYKKQELSFVEFKTGSQRWEPKKWDFSGRGPEYLNGWTKILDAMKSAVEYGKEELKKGE